jgi:hypothetical protein
MQRFGAFKLSFDVDILVFFGHFFQNFWLNFMQLSGHTGRANAW